MNARNTRGPSRAFCHGLPALVFAIAAWTAAAPALAQSSLPEECVVSVVNQVGSVQPDGSWDIPAVAANMGPVRARLTCLDDGRTLTGSSGLFTVTANRMNAIPRIELGSAEPTPAAIALALATQTFTAAGQTEQATVTATFSDGSLRDVTAAGDGTVYSTTDREVATIDADGLVTARASGRALITALHEAIFDSIAVTVRLGGDSDGDGMPDDFELANGLDPNDPVDALEDLDGDGLGNRREFELGTDLADVDSDGDGLADGEEVVAGADGFVTSPLLSDSDGDGVRDPLEVDFGTDPTDPASVDYGPLLVGLEAEPASFPLVHNTALPDEVSRRVLVRGRLVDGSVADLTARGTRFVSSDLAVASFGEEPGRIFAGADGTATVTASHSGFETPISVTVSTFSPVALSFLRIPGFANGVAVEGRFAYVAAGVTGLHVVNVSVPEEPFIAGSVDTPGNANDVQVAGGLVYVADGLRGLQVVDASIPSMPVIVGTVDTPGVATDLVLDGDRVYVADGEAGVAVLDVADPTSPRLVGRVDTPGNARGIDAGGGFVVVADTLEGIRVIDVSNPAAPAIVGSTETRPGTVCPPACPDSAAAAVAVSDRLAFVADGADLNAGTLPSVDFSVPTTPVVAGQLRANFGPSAVALAGKVAMVTDWAFSSRVLVIDIRQTEPVIRDIIDFSGLPSFRSLDRGNDVAVQGNLLFLVADHDKIADNGVTGNSGLHIAQYFLLQDNAGIPPTVEITAPAAGESFLERRVLTLRAAARDDIQVESVRFVVDGEPVARDFAAPYKLDVTIPEGADRLTVAAVATDLGGNQAASEEVTVTVLPDDDPTVSLLSPVAGSRAIEGTLLPVAAVASDDIAVTAVDVFVDGTAAASLFAAPYRFDVEVPVGVSEITVRAVAMDEAGQSATSEPVVVAVDPDLPPSVALVEPTDGSEVVAESIVRVVAAASDDVAVAAVEFLVDGMPVFEDDSAPFVLELEVPPDASRIVLSAVAVDFLGQDTASSDVTLTVIPDPGTTIAGSVLFQDGSPAVGATVSALGVATTTDGDGAFLLEAVPTTFGPITAEVALETAAGTLRGRSAEVDPLPGALLDVGAIVLSRPPVLGMVTDTADSVTVFDGDGDSVLATVPLASDLRISDCSVTSDQTLGFVADGALPSRVWVIDLTSTPPGLAAGTNPLATTSRVVDTAISRDERFLVICDGSAASVFDLVTRDLVDALALGVSCSAVDVCDDGSVLIASAPGSVLRRLTLDGSGALSDTGESLAVDRPGDVVCAPGAASGIVTTVLADQLLSFTLPGLAPKDVLPLGESQGYSAEIHPAGDRVFVRLDRPQGHQTVGAVEVFAFDAATAALGTEPLLEIAVSPISGTSFGVERLALHPDGSKLYVPEAGALNVYDATSGSLLAQITTADFRPFGICFARAP